MRVDNNKSATAVRQAPSAAELAKLKKLHMLARGSRGPQVIYLQKILKAQGLYNGAIDGQFGPITQAAVKAFQAKHGLKVDGIVGQQTWGATMGVSLAPGRNMLAARPAHSSAGGSSFAPSPGGRWSGGGVVSGSTNIPAALRKYGNGHIPPSALTSIGGGHRLYGPAAKAYLAMVEAARKDGIRIDITDSYRSYAAQVDVKRRKPRLAATPGRSKHGWGLAVDVDTGGGAYAWLRKNAAKFGFVKTVSYENWHWEYRGKL